MITHTYMKQITTIIVLLLVSWNIAAQENKMPYEADLRDSDSFSFIDSYYRDGSFLDHSYSYELSNRIKYLRMQKRNIITLGFVTTMGSLAVGSMLAINNDWSLWVYIPSATLIAMTEIAAFSLWADSVENKAAALEQHTSYILSMTDNIDMGLTRYSRKEEESFNGLGLAIKFKF